MIPTSLMMNVICNTRYAESIGYSKIFFNKKLVIAVSIDPFRLYCIDPMLL